MIGRALRPTRSELGVASLSGLLFALSFPPLPLVFPVFLCLIPIALWIVREADGAGTLPAAGRLGLWFGVIGYGLSLYWIAIALSLYTKLAILGYIGALLVLAIVTSAMAAALFAARRAAKLPMAILLPVVWVASEVVLNYLPQLAFPWLPLGLAVAHVPVLAQAADLSGVRGLSVWIASTSGLLLDAWLLRARRGAVLGRVAAAFALLVLVTGYGEWRLRTTRLRPVAPIAIVQPNIPQEDKWQAANRDRIAGILDSLTTGVERSRRAELIAWPEVALPGFLIEHPEWRMMFAQLAARGHTPVLFGVLDVRFSSPTDYEYYNAAMLADSAGRILDAPVYHKHFLVPVVERVPFVNPKWFSAFRYFGAFGVGDSTPLFRFPFGDVGVLICYESIFPELSRAYRREGADVLLNITNDAWFGRSLAPYQHFAELSMRAIENRVGIVRAANTGISGYIDPLGIPHGETALFVPATGTYEAQTTDVRTLYVALGDWAGTLCSAATVALLVLYELRRRRRTPAERADDEEREEGILLGTPGDEPPPGA